MRILEWNVNGRGNADHIVPKFISEELIKMDVDIAILTEFSSGKSDFHGGLNSAGYCVFYNQIRNERRYG